MTSTVHWVSFQDPPDSRFHHRSAEAAKAKGIQIFISTGRPRVIINNLAALQERKLIDGYITMNGAYCFVDDTKISKSPIPAAEVDALTGFCHERTPRIPLGEHDVASISRANS